MYKQLLIYILFFFSGISGLVYETIWLRILGRILGNTVYATSIVLAVFMAGMALGSYIIGKYADKHKNPLKLYAILETGVGLSAFILYFAFDGLVPLYKIIYNFSGGERLALTFFQLIFLFLLLLIPTTLMGGTLPLLTSYTKKFNISFTSRIGNLYGLNTMGAVVGVIGSGLFTIGALGEMLTLFIGVIINLLVSFTALYMDKLYNKKDEVLSHNELNTVTISSYSPFVRKMILLMYIVNGFTAIAYEVVWSRILQIHLGTSIYSFSMMLGIYLTGVALGSIFAGKFVSRLKEPLGFFGMSQIFIALYSIAGLYIFTLFKFPYSSINISNIISVPFFIVFPITFVLGILFPVVARCYIGDENNSGLGVGFLYSMNTIGGIIGSLICGFILIKILGTRNTILVLSGMNIIVGFIASFLSYNRFKYIFPISAVVILSIFLSISSPDPFMEVVKNNIKERWPDVYSDFEIYYHKESSVATTTAFGITKNPLIRELWINGTGMTSLFTETKLMSHIPILLHNSPRDMLIVCMGMGTTLRSAMIHKNIKCDVVELVPEVYEAYKYFHSDGDKILGDSGVNHYVDDGRNFLLMSNKLYDVITIDPAPPIWSSGTVNLYSKEFFELCKTKLNKDGIVCLWVPPGHFTEVRMILSTFLYVFPNTEVWGGPIYPGLYLIGTEQPLKINKDNFFKENHNSKIISDLNEFNNVVPNPESILKLHITNGENFRDFVKNIPIITDNNPYTEFPLWRLKFDPSNEKNLDAFYLCKYLQSLER